MAIKSNKTLGFTLIEASLAIVTVFILAGLSFAVYQHTKTSATTTNAQSNPYQNNTTQTTQPAPTVSYLTIKEWGIKLPLSNNIKDAYYVASKDTENGVPVTMWIGLKTLTDSSCNPSNNDHGGTGAIGAIYRFSPTAVDGVSGQPLTQKYPNGTTIGGYYYTFAAWNVPSTCASDTTVQPIDSAFVNASKGQAVASTN
jgi:Tfp pilus assembly major pilin PilA